MRLRVPASNTTSRKVTKGLKPGLFCQTYTAEERLCCTKLTLMLLTWRIWWAPNNASKWQVGFNSAFKGLNLILSRRSRNKVCHTDRCRRFKFSGISRPVDVSSYRRFEESSWVKQSKTSQIFTSRHGVTSQKTTLQRHRLENRRPRRWRRRGSVCVPRADNAHNPTVSLLF